MLDMLTVDGMNPYYGLRCDHAGCGSPLLYDGWRDQPDYWEDGRLTGEPEGFEHGRWWISCEDMVDHAESVGWSTDDTGRMLFCPRHAADKAGAGGGASAGLIIIADTRTGMRHVWQAGDPIRVHDAEHDQTLFTHIQALSDGPCLIVADGRSLPLSVWSPVESAAVTPPRLRVAGRADADPLAAAARFHVSVERSEADPTPVNQLAVSCTLADLLQTVVEQCARHGLTGDRLADAMDGAYERSLNGTEGRA